MIEFNNPKITLNLKGIKRTNVYSSDGFYSKKCEKWLVNQIKCKSALVVKSCTAALEMCALLLNIKDGDEIIMPSFTFVSTANAFVLRGAKPVFVDIDLKTCNIDPSKITQAISKKTKAIVVVHYAGISCDMDTILKIAKKHNLYIIEDAAHALLSFYKKKRLGSIGDLATFSFHETKNIHCGEGGALLINNHKFIERARIIRDKGTNRDLFNKKMVNKYTWVGNGSAYGLSEINAIILYSQLKHAKKITKKRVKIFKEYQKQLKDLEIKKFVKRPSVPKYSNHNGHIFYILVMDNRMNKLMKYLKQKKINSFFHYVPLHSSPYGRLKTKVKSTMCNTNFISNNLLRLPMHVHLSSKDIKKCTNQIKSFFNKLT
jgi:dTDP-4-amino-4,6-dideoxygalactose transaminase